MKSKTLATRVPSAFAAQVEAAAAAAGLTTSEYIERVLRCRSVPSYPVLAALAGVIRIAATIARASDFDSALREELGAHVATLSAAARNERT